MRRFLVGVFVLTLPLAHAGIRTASARASAPDAAQSGAPPAATPSAAAPAGKADAGKVVWALGNTSCRNCHGENGEGAFGPALAGRKLTYEWMRNYVRNPTGKMPAYIPSELTDQEIADLATYFESLPAPEKPAAWRTPLPKGAPLGQQLAIALVGCAQCHGATLETPRHGAAEVSGDWDWFQHQVYEHTSAIREQWAVLDPNLPRVTPGPGGPAGRDRIRMGNYDRNRLPEALLRQMFDWAMDLGLLPPLTGQVTAGAADTSGAIYTLNVINAGAKGKGVTAEDVTVSVILPTGTTVSNATGTGYQGVQADEASKASAAVWRVPRMAAADRQTFTLKLSSATPTLRGTIRWAKPTVKSDDVVNFAMANGGRGRGAGTPN